MKAIEHGGEARKKRTSLFLVGAAVIGGLLVVLLANAHLVYVSVMSQPECVEHIKASETPAPKGSFSAAASAC